MSRRRLRDEILGDLAEAASWYERRRRGLGLTFLEAVEATLLRIEDTPRQFPVVYRDLRRSLLPRPFPYQILFRIHGDFVDIYAVLHTARNPEEWRRRRDLS